YVVPTGRVVVPTGRYVVPAGKVIIIVSPGRLSLVPTGSKDLSRVGSNTFGGSKGYITGNGRIRVGNLDFDSVSFVKELGHFNLFSILQICDKQHKVLFTETECLVVSLDFKTPDETQILLKVPRQHNMYSFDMKTPALIKDYACLIAKATSDESKLWHMRLEMTIHVLPAKKGSNIRPPVRLN
ncbi:hypothetical protein Tco_1527712, partial [Tanacetum coccineum]